MRRIIFPLLIGVFFLTLQATLLASLFTQRIRPDIALILTLYLGLSYPPISGGILVFFIGFLMDLFSGNSLGLYTVSRPIVFFVAQFFKERFYLENFASQFLFVFIFAMMEGLLVLFIFTALLPYPHINLYTLLFTFLLPQSFFTALISPILFSLFDKGSFYLFRHHGMGMSERG